MARLKRIVTPSSKYLLHYGTRDKDLTYFEQRPSSIGL